MKLIIFLWKICTDCLPTKKEINIRMENVDPTCALSNSAEKSCDHLFLKCEFARVVWFASHLGLRLDNSHNQSIKSCIIDWILNAKLSKC